MESRSACTSASTKTVPFEELPNLPKPRIPQIDLGIQRIGLEALLQIRPSLESFRKIGHSIADQGTQTDQSDILDLKYVIEMLRTLTMDTAQLRKDLTYAQSVLKANYEKQISDRSTELYCRINERLLDLEKQYKTKIDRTRKSYQSQLENAIQVVAGEYKAYYNDLLKGKKGRHDMIIQDLKEQLVNREVLLRQQQSKIEEMEAKMAELEEANELNGGASLTSEPPGLSAAEGESLQREVKSLTSTVETLQSSLALREDENSQLSEEVEKLKKSISDQQNKYKLLEKDMANFQKKAKQDKESAARLAENQLATMEKQLKAQMEQAEREAAEKAQEQAEMQRMKDQAKYLEEMEKRNKMEEQLRAQALAASQVRPQEPAGDKELLAQIAVLTENDKRQTELIARLRREIERINKTWELKMTVMRKNFHALKDEFFIRNSFKRQSAALQHSTVGYAVNTGEMQVTKNELKEAKPVIPSLNFSQQQSPGSKKSGSSSGPSDSSRRSLLLEESILAIPPPSPNSVTQGISPRVHFGSEAVDQQSSFQPLTRFTSSRHNNKDD